MSYSAQRARVRFTPLLLSLLSPSSADYSMCIYIYIYKTQTYMYITMRCIYIHLVCVCQHIYIEHTVWRTRGDVCANFLFFFFFPLRTRFYYATRSINNDRCIYSPHNDAHTIPAIYVVYIYILFFILRLFKAKNFFHLRSDKNCFFFFFFLR